MRLQTIFKTGVIGIAFIGGFASCVSTETIEPPKAAGSASEEIAIMFSTPEDVASTRAEDGYKLRYLAKLLKYSSPVYELIDRKEIIEGENDNQIVFHGETGSTYMVVCFADYIPADAAADEKGCYKDYFYDTTNDQKVSFRTDPEGGSSKVMPTFFNNDYYDCFSMYYYNFKKEDGKKILDTPLERPVARVRFVDENLTAENFESIKVEYFQFNNEFYHEKWNVFPSNNLKLNGVEIESPANLDQKEILYFYTFAADKKSNLPGGTYSFTITNTDGTSKETKITSDIPAQRNYVTTVKGKFIPTEEVSQNPGNDNDDDKGEIEVRFDTNKEWGNDPNISTEIE